MTCAACARANGLYELSCTACCRRFMRDLRPTYGEAWTLEQLATFGPAEVAEACRKKLDVIGAA